MIKIIVVLCSLSSPANCHEETVTTSDFADVSMQSCLMGGAPQLAEWMKQHPAERLAAWRCDWQTGWQGSLGWKAAFLAGVRGQSDRGRSRLTEMVNQWRSLNADVPGIFLAAAAVAFSIAPQLGEAGPCSSDIAELETAIQQPGVKALGALEQPSVNVQLGQKSTPKSARLADEHLQSQFSATVARAKRLDMYGDRFGASAPSMPREACTFWWLNSEAPNPSLSRLSIIPPFAA
jgi:hypothetical protein